MAMQAVYQWHMAGGQPDDVVAQYTVRANTGDGRKVDVDYFIKLFRGVMQECQELDAMCRPWLDRELETVTPIELALLRIGVYELTRCGDIPVSVVIHEAIEIAKGYGACQSYKFINGVLDKVAATRCVRTNARELGKT